MYAKKLASLEVVFTLYSPVIPVLSILSTKYL